MGTSPEAPIVGAAGSETPAVACSGAACVGGGGTTGASCVGGGTAAPLVGGCTGVLPEGSVRSISMGSLQENKRSTCENSDKRDVVDDSNKRERKTRES